MEDTSTWFIIAGIVFAAFSEIIGMNPKAKSNSVVQLILAIGKKVFKKGSK